MVIFFICLAKKTKTIEQLYLRCCKTMQLEICGFATKVRFVHCLQRVVHYFKGKSIYSKILFHVIPTK